MTRPHLAIDRAPAVWLQHPAVIKNGLLLAALAAVYLAGVVGLGRFATADEAYYKAAGREWARSGHFAAPELEGILGPTKPGIEEVFAYYPPLYPFLFGLFVRVFGFAWPQCVLFDAIIHLALVAATCSYARQVDPRLPDRTVLVLGVALLPLGHPARPDELSMFLGMGCLVTLLGSALGVRAACGAGVALGLCAATSPAAAALFAATALVIIAKRPDRARANVLRAVVAIAALLALAAAIAPVYATHRGAWRQFVFGVAEIWVRYSGKTFVDAWAKAWLEGKPALMLYLACAFVGLVGAAIRPSAIEHGRWSALWLTPILWGAAVLVLLPGHTTYVWLAVPLLWVASWCTLRGMAAERRALATGGVALVAAAWLGASVPFFVQRYIMATLPDTQSFGYVENKLRTIIPDGGKVVVFDAWWSLGGRCRVFEGSWFVPTPRRLAEIEFFVRSANGTGVPGRPVPLSRDLEEYVDTHFEVVEDLLNRSPTTLFGVRVTNSAYGFGPLILRRRGYIRPPSS